MTASNCNPRASRSRAAGATNAASAGSVAACAMLGAWLVGASLLLSAPGVAHAQETVIYRCTDAKGALSFQNNVPCAKGSKQERKVVQPAQTVATPQLAPTPRAPAAVVPIVPAIDKDPAADALPPSTVADADRLPPPPLYQCNTYDKDSYLSENPEPKARCVALQTTGLDGNSDTGAGEACSMVTDQCQRVPDNAACDAWRKRAKEVEATWRFARAADKEANQVEYRRVSEMLRDSSCGK